jgi:hypothetical protein
MLRRVTGWYDCGGRERASVRRLWTTGLVAVEVSASRYGCCQGIDGQIGWSLRTSSAVAAPTGAEAPMRTRRPIDTTLAPTGRLARGPLLALVLALALALTIAAAGTALAAPGHPSGQERTAPAGAAARAGTAAADQAAAEEPGAPSPVVPLVFAGILLLAVASPALPRHPRFSRYGYDRGERW